jgi:hypothetical protein|nr:MAG TPA: hypothetical protein [Caudoviricetes sp.]
MFDKTLNNLKYSSKEELNKKLNEGDTIEELDFIADIGEILKYSKEDIEEAYKIVVSKNQMIMVMSVFYDQNKVEPFIVNGCNVNYSSKNLDDFSFEVWVALKENLNIESIKLFVKCFVKSIFDNM